MFVIRFVQIGACVFYVLPCSGTYNRLHVLKSDRLLQHHLVERPNKESLQKQKKATKS